MTEKFRIAVTNDVLGSDGRPFFSGLGLELLDDEPTVEWEILPERHDELRPEHTDNFDGILLLSPLVTRNSFGSNPRTTVIARFGVGFDNVDLTACSDMGVALTITPDAVRRPVATAMLAMVLALAHRIRERDNQVREGRWSERFTTVGTGLRGGTVGLIGLGRIGLDFCKLLAPHDVRIVAFDPHADPAVAQSQNVTLVPLDELLRSSDFVCIAAPLTESTRGLVDAAALAKMKRTAFLVNAARGPIVVQSHLVDALREQRIAGAALDVFDPEPPEVGNPLFGLDNVLLTPHTIAHTDHLYKDCIRSATGSLLEASRGSAPVHTVNRDVLTSERFLAKLNSRLS